MHCVIAENKDIKGQEAMEFFIEFGIKIPLNIIPLLGDILF